MFNSILQIYPPKDLVSLYLIAFQILVAMYLKTLGRERAFFVELKLLASVHEN